MTKSTNLLHETNVPEAKVLWDREIKLATWKKQGGCELSDLPNKCRGIERNTDHYGNLPFLEATTYVLGENSVNRNNPHRIVTFCLQIAGRAGDIADIIMTSQGDYGGLLRELRSTLTSARAQIYITGPNSGNWAAICLQSGRYCMTPGRVVKRKESCLCFVR